MISQVLKLASCGVVLACSGCIAVPAPGQVAAAPPPMAAPSGPYCREYQQTVIIGGQWQQAVGTTCQQADGTWKLAGAPVDRPRPPRAVAYPAYPYPAYPSPYVLVPVGPATSDTPGSDHNK